MARRKKSGSGGWRRGEFVAGIVLGLVLALWVVPNFTEWWSQPSSGTPADNPSSSPTFDFYEILERGEEVVEETLASRPAAGESSTAEPVPEPTASEPAEPSTSEAVPETVAATAEPADLPVSASEPGPPAPTPVDTPGMYVLQMGAFTRQTQAESLKARLGLVGMTARIQPVMVDRQTYYRVRIGPTDDLAQLNADRARLQQHRFDSILLKLVQ